ncbi:type IV toxin-antitoxin system AbiEi family antitoxin domain-containing protein [Rhodococcus sp. IEGM 1381]|uniref:type IV toxin-antitoxin system AbiEi family antitoxin domain-containing protein n=1 Tax=Rhodococcus sp. IEGM 1381 TaxID=3047085 RepID=UPI0024B82761|nr:type IV toxin-antitoxin system AbiEi family antitoxin domain-containing protein [Rhodococcus sp. IEGM 1381]MDI9894928.1 type IV toxin-antitoxin system AbiEi family antitoxin domain-containing protein [Rhodococcus sp. IEGM 1381]
MDFDRPGLFSRADAHRAGFTDNDLRRARTQGSIVAIRPGWYLRDHVLRTLDGPQQHAILAQATYLDSVDGAVLSHVSAAVIHGFDVWNVPLDRVHMTIGAGYPSKRTRRRELHGTTLEDNEWVHLTSGARQTFQPGSLPVTNPARTIVDIARSVPLEQAVCTGDYALRHARVTHVELAQSIMSAKHRTGIGRARRAVEMMSDRSDSVGETRARLIFEAVTPVLCNQSVYDDNGDFLARVDHVFPDLGEVIGEFDGVYKYGAEPRRAVLAEKERHNRLLEQGRTVFRYGWGDLANPSVLIERLSAAHRRALRQGPPSGWFTELPLPKSTPLPVIDAPFRGSGLPRGA